VLTDWSAKSGAAEMYKADAKWQLPPSKRQCLSSGTGRHNQCKGNMGNKRWLEQLQEIASAVHKEASIDADTAEFHEAFQRSLQSRRWHACNENLTSTKWRPSALRLTVRMCLNKQRESV
jgi:hypothetical protein